MTRQFRSGFLIAAALAFSVIPRWASAQAYGPVAGPLYQSGLQHEMYVGYQRLSTDYSLATASGDRTAVTSGLDLQYRWHGSNNHLAVVGEAQSNRGTLLGQKLNTAAVGGVYVATVGRYAPFAQILGGASRLTSTDSMYLQTDAKTGLALLYGAGLDIHLTSHWGIRPVYFEEQYLPSFGPRGSVYWKAGTGILYRFSCFGIGH